MGNALSDKELKLMDAYWRAANYLSVGQIYLYRQSAAETTAEARAHQTPAARPLGDDAGPEFSLRSLNRVIKQQDLNMIYIIGPGHGGPGIRGQCLPGRDLHARCIRTSPRTKRE